MWAHPPMVLPVGAPAAAANNGGPNRNYGLKSGSLLLQHKRHGRQWLTLDPSAWVDEAQGEEEAEAEAEAELEAEAEEKRRLDYVSWLPKPGSVRAWILDALKNGHYHRDAIYKHVSLQPGMLEEHEELKSTLRSTVVTSLGKEKNARVPLFEQDDEHYPYP